MTPAISSATLRTFDRAANLVALPLRSAATICTGDGRYITAGIIDVRHGERGWSGRMRHMEQAGLVASLYFAEGIREVVVRLEDGRRARARITSTNFVAESQRICDLEGMAEFV